MISYVSVPGNCQFIEIFLSPFNLNYLFLEYLKMNVLREFSSIVSVGKRKIEQKIYDQYYDLRKFSMVRHRITKQQQNETPGLNHVKLNLKLDKTVFRDIMRIFSNFLLLNKSVVQVQQKRQTEKSTNQTKFGIRPGQ